MVQAFLRGSFFMIFPPDLDSVHDLQSYEAMIEAV